MLTWVSKKLGLGAVPQEKGLEALVRDALGGSSVDGETVQIVASTVGVLLCVAFADGTFCQAEEAKLREVLGKIQSLDPSRVNLLVARLRDQAVEITSKEATSYARQLKTLTAFDYREVVLATLLELAAADGSISLSENNMLRNVARALGFDQSDYNAAQAKHRDQLAVLRR